MGDVCCSAGITCAHGDEHSVKAVNLSYFTITYNIIEGIVSILAGTLAGSISLVGFGLDSFVESLSAGVVLWRFGRHGHASGAERKAVEKRATRMVGATLFLLAAYVAIQSGAKLYWGDETETTLFGLGIPIVSIIVMLALYRQKRNLGNEIHSHSLLADAKQTLACMIMSVAVLAGFAVYYMTGFWQADAIAGIIIAVLLAREGYRAIREEELCGC